MDFHKDGDTFVATAADNSLQVFDLLSQNPEKTKTLHNKDHGHNIVRFTHDKNTVIVNTKHKEGNDRPGLLRMWSIYDNEWVRDFAGHAAHINSLCMSPKDDSVISASVNGEIRLWDLNMSRCMGKCTVNCGPSARPCVAFDNQVRVAGRRGREAERRGRERTGGWRLGGEKFGCCELPLEALCGRH